MEQKTIEILKFLNCSTIEQGIEKLDFLLSEGEDIGPERKETDSVL